MQATERMHAALEGAVIPSAPEAKARTFQLAQERGARVRRGGRLLASLAAVFVIALTPVGPAAANFISGSLDIADDGLPGIAQDEAAWSALLDKERESGGCARILEAGYNHPLCQEVIDDLAAQDSGTYQGRMTAP